MRKKTYTRIGAAAMAMVLAISGLSVPSSVQAAGTASAQTQMTSGQEVVYANLYGVSAERSQNFDSNWKFYLGDAADAQVNAFDDSKWRQVNLPHDYSIEQEYSKSMEAESAYLPGGTGWYRKSFTVDAALEGKQLRIDFGGVYMNATVWINGTQLGTHPYGYTPFSFDITDYVNYGGENVIAVKVDHQTPSSRWYSGSGIYRSVYLTVMEDVHVDLYGTDIKTENLESEQGGTVNMAVTTTVANAGDAAADVVLVHTVYEKGTTNSIGTVTTAAQSVAAGASADIAATLPANNPKLWDITSPNLYNVVTEVKVGDTVVDTYETEYGFRYFSFNNNTGFSLNGRPVKLKGVCMHHDQGSLGSEAHYRAIERQVEILQEMGCNSIRVTHNPAANELIEICNEKGILVIDELFDGWMYHKNGNSNDYATWFQQEIEDGNTIVGAADGMTWARFDLQATLNRGKNAPSVIMWSLGNEIQEGAGGSGYNTMAASLIEWAQAEDTTQLLTIGSNDVKNGTAEHIDIANQLTAVGGVSGTNYSGGSSYDSLHTNHPNWNLYGSETASHVNSRGVYDRLGNTSDNGGAGQTADKQLTSYDNSRVGWGATSSSAWYEVIKRDFVAGEYVWTGFDYLGEPTPWNGTGAGAVGDWESPKNSYFGIIDTAGLPKDNYYFYQSQWNEDVTTLHVLPAWNEDVVNKDNAKGVPVVVYSDAACVELFLTDAEGNRESLGKKAFTKHTTDAGYTYQMYEGEGASTVTHQNMYLTWYVPYEDGTIEAVAYSDTAGTQKIAETVGRSSVTTTGEEAKLDANVDRDTIAADGKDLAYITVDVTDADGNIVPDACNNVKVTVEGNGVLVGVDNGKQADHQSFQDDNRDAYNGTMIAIVQSTKEEGSFTVTVKSEGLQSDTVTVTTVADAATTEKQVDSFYMSKAYYVKTGNQPQLPETITVRYTDKTSEEVAVTWNEITEEQISKAGSFAVQGTITVDGQPLTVSVNINMIDEIGGILNYSTNTQVGVVPNLPDTRQVVMPDGTVLSAAFEVDWEEPEADSYNQAGRVVISGTTTVFGETIPVTATVRVQEEEISVGDVITAKKINLKQNIADNLQTGNLAAVDDGNTAYDANAYWSNKTYVEAGNTMSTINFGYDTEQRFGEITIYFASNTDAGISYPAADSVTVYTSPDGSNWTELQTTETIGEDSNGVKAYTYSFGAKTAEQLKFEITGNTAVGITEIETKKAVGSYTTYSSAALESLTVNGIAVSDFYINKGSYSTPALFAEVEAAGAENAAVTVLSATKESVLIIIESEDHETRTIYEVKLNQPMAEEPEDDSRDYPIANMTATAGIELNPADGNEGMASFAIDGNTATHWHTDWRNGVVADTLDERWLMVELTEATLVDGIRSLPRQSGNTNGSVTEYSIQYKLTEDAEWTEAATGTWSASERGWKQVSFEPVMAKYVRIVGVHTYADSGNDTHMAMSEFRVQKAADRVDITKPENNVTIEVPESIAVGVLGEERPAEIEAVVKAGEETLRYGIDYLLQYSDNTALGTATVNVVGITGYRGTVTKNFEITKAAVASISVAKAADKVNYIVGEKFDPTGLEVAVVYADNSSEVFPYNAEGMTIAPTAETALAEDNKAVTITYGGQTTTMPITVERPAAASVSLDKTTLSLEAGKTGTLTATVLPANAKDKITWTTSDAAVATVANGVVTAVKAGTATITAATVNGLKATCTVTVTAASDDGNEGNIQNPSDGNEGNIQNPSDGNEGSTPEPGKDENVKKPLAKNAAFTLKGMKYKVTKSHATKGEVALAKVTSKAKTINIPSTVTKDGIKYKVTSIGTGAFKNNKKVTKIKGGSNIKSIGASAFQGCTSLTSVTIGTKVSTIGNKAFFGCKKLKNVLLPKSVSKLGASVFEKCTKLKTITIKNTKLNKKNINKKAFKGIGKSTTIKVPKAQVKAYKKMFKSKGLSSKVKVTK